jgi:UDP-N-acetylglucosamine:LPS N-acetylglucosamine transferase
MTPPRDGRLLLVSSSGGVLLDLLALEPFWSRHDHVWAVVRAPDTESALRGRDVRWLEEKSISRPSQLVRGVPESLRILRGERVTAVLSSGTAAAVPFFVSARLLGIPSLWISTFNLIRTPGLAARVCSRLATTVLVQRESMRTAHPRAVLVGELY